MIRPPHIILLNASIRGCPPAMTCLAVTDGVISGIGRESDLLGSADRGTIVIDCGGRALLPGIVDEHCHIFAAAAISSGVDCRPAATPTVDAVVRALRTAKVRSDGWIRGYGYDDSPLGLGRHLDRRDLDAASVDIPIRVDHRSGHACVLNSAGLRAAGISKNSVEPPGATIVRDVDGEPSGLLFEMSAWLRQRASRESGTNTHHVNLRQISHRMLEYGITGATDAGHDNGIEEWCGFGEAIQAGIWSQRVKMMVGFTHLAEMRQAGLEYGDTFHNGMLEVSHAKIMLTASSGTLRPHPYELSSMVGEAHSSGFPVAIHAVERDAVVAAAVAIADNPSPVGRDRIEHCGECPPDVAELVVNSGAWVVPNTGFLHYDGERYIETVADSLLPHLYPAGALAALGVPVALGSDAPVVEPNPWAAMAAAVTRRTAAGNQLGGIGLASVAAALDQHTGGNRITVGSRADLTVVEPNPFETATEELPGVRAVLTLVAGRMVWRSGF